MNRRHFLRSGGSAAVGLLTLGACNKNNLLGLGSFNGRVVVVGAGAAGLYAGFLMKARGMDFEILEASFRVGGRLAKLEGFADYALDLGAEWLHGRNSLAADLAARHQVMVTPDNSEPVYVFQGGRIVSPPLDPELFEQKGLPDVSFWDYAQQQGYSSQHRWLVEALAAEYGASASKISAYWNAQEFRNWSAGDEDLRFARTYYDLLYDHVAFHVLDKIRFNTVVTGLDFSGKRVEIHTLSGEVFEADKVILTVPLSVLQKGLINFNPPLPEFKTKAFAAMGMEGCVKFFLKFQQRFYDAMLLGGEVCASYYDASLGKPGKDAVLMGMAMGQQAEKLVMLGSSQAMTQAVLDELDSLYAGQASANFVTAYFQDWGSEPFIQGAYSYSTVGMGVARSVAADDVDGKIYFAGEAMNLNGHHQTVHGAMETAWQCLVKILA
jgi:lysine-specific histone demethylase 1B